MSWMCAWVIVELVSPDHQGCLEMAQWPGRALWFHHIWFLWHPVVAGATDLNTDPIYSRSLNPDMALSSSLGPNETMTLGGSQSHKMILFLFLSFLSCWFLILERTICSSSLWSENNFTYYLGKRTFFPFILVIWHTENDILYRTK